MMHELGVVNLPIMYLSIEATCANNLILITAGQVQLTEFTRLGYQYIIDDYGGKYIVFENDNSSKRLCILGKRYISL